MIHVFIGTKAQYIKTAPVVRLMDQRSIPYRLIDTGQHAELSETLRRELAVRRPDVLLGGGGDVTSIPQAIGWSLRLATRLVSRRRVRSSVFNGLGGVCVVHGDTPSTLLSAALAWRAGIPVAHLEAGLRSHRLTHPFPEELIRLVVMRMARLLFAPDRQAAANLAAMGVRGDVVELSANTSLDAVRFVLDDEPRGQHPGIVTLHRVENLHRRERLEGLVQVLEDVGRPLEFVVHEPTRRVLERRGLTERLERAGIHLRPLLGHRDFINTLAQAAFVITDGGSVQEECALLGVPTLLWRDRTERPDGLGENVVLSKYDRALTMGFIANPNLYRRQIRNPQARPSEEILDVLVSRFG